MTEELQPQDEQQHTPRFPWIVPVVGILIMFACGLCFFSILPSAGDPGLSRITDANAALETAVAATSTLLAQTPAPQVTQGAPVTESATQTPVGPTVTQPARITGDVWRDQELATEWYLAEGITKSGYLTIITLLNPNDTLATITVVYTLENGEKVERQHTIPPVSPLTILANSDSEVGFDRVFVTDIFSDVPIAVGQVVYLENG